MPRQWSQVQPEVPINNSIIYSPIIFYIITYLSLPYNQLVGVGNKYVNIVTCKFLLYQMSSASNLVLYLSFSRMIPEQLLKLRMLKKYFFKEKCINKSLFSLHYRIFWYINISNICHGLVDSTRQRALNSKSSYHKSSWFTLNYICSGALGKVVASTLTATSTLYCWVQFSSQKR